MTLNLLGAANYQNVLKKIYGILLSGDKGCVKGKNGQTGKE